jgi:hypothetical protein
MTQFHFQFPFSGWDHWPGLRHGPSRTRWLGALTWPSWPMCGPWARFSRPGVCLKPPEMKPCVRWWPYRPGNLASKRNPRRILFFPNVLCGRSCNLSSTRQDSLERITGSSLRFQQWEATGNRAARPVTFPRLLHKLLGVNTDTHNSCHLPMLMSSVTRTALGFQVYAEMGWWSQWRQQQFWGPDVAPDGWRQTNWRQPVMRDRGINNSGNSMLNLVLSQQLLRTGKPWVLDITWSNNGWIWVNK